MPYLAVFLLPLITSLLLTPVAQRLSLRLGIMAEPGGRRSHGGPMPKLGGMPLLGAFLVGVALTYLLLPPMDEKDALRLRGVVIGTLVIFAGGLIDDWRELGPRGQFFIHFLGAVIAMGHIIFIEVFTNPFPFASGWPWTWEPLTWAFTLKENQVWVWRPLALLFTLLWVVGMINAVNWLDGLDGLAAGVSTIAVLLFAWHSYRLGQTTVPLFPLALAGAMLGFLPYNFAPARVFLGSAGAYLLGYNLATLSILSPAKLSTALLVMAVPILDGVWRILDRLRHGHSPFYGDRGHLHHLLSDSGLPTPVIVLGYYALAIAFGLVAIFAPSPVMKLAMLIIVGTAVLILLIWLSSRSERLARQEKVQKEL